LKLNTLLDHIEINRNDAIPDTEIKGISTNSKTIQIGEVFVAIPGFKVDGHNFIDKAIEVGASVIVGEKDLRDLTVPYIQVTSSRLALAKLACQYYGYPSKKKIVIGITGTNGKTTTSFMLKSILEACGRTCSIFGSINNVVNGQVFPSINTTPDALELQRQLALSEDEYTIIEVSSQGLTQYRVAGMEFDYCLFTNLDRDHLDYHQDMNEYFSVKASLFDQLKPDGKAIVNQYNHWGKKLKNQLKQKDEDIYILGDNLKIKKSKTNGSTQIIEGNQTYKLSLKILGYHNVLNASMAFLTARQMGLSSTSIIKALEMFPGVPGRFEIIEHPIGATIVIDYAHTAEAFYHCLQTAKDSCAKRVFHIFGFRGNRDTGKRREMVNVSQELSDVSILTFDDLDGVPYDEMEQSLHHLNQIGWVIPDRTLAIKEVLEQVIEGDWVFITGKGAETYELNFQIPTVSDIDTVQYFLSLEN
jgi:UDP-N-acetylmuramoyl-L-alanyl-D-glutamate--2,6-diaminopimelate ligase